jgi:hypothetical protein
MKMQWTLAAVLSGALAVGCGDRSANTENPEENTAVPAATAPETEAPVAEAPPGGAAPSRADGSAVRDTRASGSGARPTTGRDIAPAPAASASSAAPAAPGTRAPAAPATPPAPRFRDVTVPAGTALPLELTTAVSSETAQVETPVRARLRQAITVDGYTVLPANTVFVGSVIDVERAGRVKGRSRLALRFTEAQFNSQTEDVRTNPISFEGEATKGEDATKVGAGAVGGAIIGGILGGGDGAAKGAAIGGAAGTGAVLATRGREVTLPAGADLAATLATPFSIRVREN